MILSFGDRCTEDIYNGVASRSALAIRREMWPRIQRKLDLLDAATTLVDLRVPPANRLEKLKGSLRDYFSIRVNEQYRIVFRFEAGNCLDVKCTDYH